MAEAESEKNVEIMKYAFNDQPIKFKAAFGDNMKDRINDVLTSKRAEMTQTIYNKWGEDEVADLEDISDEDIEAEIDQTEVDTDPPEEVDKQIYDDEENADEEPEEQLTPEEEQELDKDEDV